MKLLINDNEKQLFINLIDAHLEAEYLHFSHYRGVFSERMSVVFSVQKNEWGQVCVQGYDFYKTVGGNAYFAYLDANIRKVLSHLPIFKQNIDLYSVKGQNEKARLIKFIDNNERLKKLNSHRSKNFIIYKNETMGLVYDTHNKVLKFESSEAFSDIEHDTNRKFTENVCVDILLDFKNKRDIFVKMLSNPYDKSYVQDYKKFIDILNGNADSSQEDIIIMISVLGRLYQEKDMGPISVQKEYKLNPKEIAKHYTLQNYIIACVSTIKEYTNTYLLNREELSQIGNIGFEGKLDKRDITPCIIPLLAYDGLVVVKPPVWEPKIIGGTYSPNYIESFFRKIVGFSEYSKVPMVIDDFKDIIVELTNFAKRFQGQTPPDFIVLAKIKSILTYKKFNSLMELVKKRIVEATPKKTYYKTVAEHILSQNTIEAQKTEFYKLLFIYENHIILEIKRFLVSKTYNSNADFNNDEISISSDMHFNYMKLIAKENFSKNFNIIAGDFFNNTYHRSGAEVNETSDIVGIGVIGNHDVNWIDSVKDIRKEINSNYSKSIANLAKAFPKVKILNNEVFYKNGIAFVGLTIVTDEAIPGRRSFFANEELGRLFSNENYFNQTKRLLDSVSPGTPIVVISHSPFKEYSVCKNKDIGVFSGKIFKSYPNVKAYIHGHGHSKQNSKIIDDVLCITNPLVRNIYSDSSFSCDWNLFSEKKKQ